MNVAGIDFSSHAVDVVTVPFDGPADIEWTRPRWTRFPLVGSDAFDRARSVADAVPGPASVIWDDIIAVGIEEPTGKFKPGLGYRIQGAILSRIPSRMLVYPLPPSKWRTLAGLKGNAPKESVAHRSRWLWLPPDGATSPLAVDTWPQDAHDAHLIALATRQAITREQAA